MRFKHPEIGDKRYITKFLFFPLRIGNETRWLELATIHQKFSKVHRWGGWINISFGGYEE